MLKYQDLIKIMPTSQKLIEINQLLYSSIFINSKEVNELYQKIQTIPEKHLNKIIKILKSSNQDQQQFLQTLFKSDPSIKKNLTQTINSLVLKNKSNNQLKQSLTNTGSNHHENTF